MYKALLKGYELDEILPILQKYNIEIVSKNPDIVITYGGDGTLLEAERQYPGIPKLPIRDTLTAPLCKEHSIEGIIKDLINNKLDKTEIIKLKGKCITANKELSGINDIFVHNVIRNNAIRYKVIIDDKIYLNEVASDCLGFATPHGSTGYFQSITHCTFIQGIGIAFSNSREHVNHIIVKDDSKIEIEVLRGPAVMVSDNNPESIQLKAGDKLIISKSNDIVQIYGLDVFMCNKCRKLRHIKI